MLYKRKVKPTMYPLKCITRSICFLLIFALILAGLSGIFVRKSLTTPWNMSVKVNGFYNEAENSLDVIYFGSSHMYCSIDPSQLEEISGLKSYIMATQEQPVWISYHYMKEALKTQDPKIMVFEVNMMVQEDEFGEEGTLHSATDPIKLSKNKVEMIYAAVPDGQRRNYIFDIIKYHGRWEELTKEDFTQDYLEEKDPLRGYVLLEQITPIESRDNLEGVTEISPPIEKAMIYLEKMITLSEEEGFKLIFIKTPSNATVAEKKIYNAAEELAKQRGVAYIDYNMHYQELGLNLETDFYDRRHLNNKGVEKFTPTFATYLMNTLEADTL